MPYCAKEKKNYALKNYAHRKPKKIQTIFHCSLQINTTDHDILRMYKNARSHAKFNLNRSSIAVLVKVKHERFTLDSLT